MAQPLRELSMRSGLYRIYSAKHISAISKLSIKNAGCSKRLASRIEETPPPPLVVYSIMEKSDAINCPL